MILSELKIHHLRNVSSAHLELNPRFNFIFGKNGSGKTSVLEAFYLISCGHSFRSRELSSIISQGQQTLTVFARAQAEETIGIQKSSDHPTQIKLNNQLCSSTSQLAYALPCHIFYADVFQIIDAGPVVRRSLLDWGLFHVKPNYLFLWKEYKKTLKQRNALLKSHAPYSHFIPWDKQLSQLATQLHALREDYFNQWECEFAQVLNALSPLDCTIKYFKGWDKKNSGKELEQLLFESFASDQQRLYTQHGAHQADILIEANQNKAKHYLSRGQQKIILLSLKLAQTHLVALDCLHLIDDLHAELDEWHQKKLMNYLASRKGQYVITSTMRPSNLIASLSDSGEEYLSYQMDNGILNRDQAC